MAQNMIQFLRNSSFCNYLIIKYLVYFLHGMETRFFTQDSKSTKSPYGLCGLFCGVKHKPPVCGVVDWVVWLWIGCVLLWGVL